MTLELICFVLFFLLVCLFLLAILKVCVTWTVHSGEWSSSLIHLSLCDPNLNRCLMMWGCHNELYSLEFRIQSYKCIFTLSIFASKAVAGEVNKSLILWSYDVIIFIIADDWCPINLCPCKPSMHENEIGAVHAKKKVFDDPPHPHPTRPQTSTPLVHFLNTQVIWVRGRTPENTPTRIKSLMSNSHWSTYSFFFRKK